MSIIPEALLAAKAEDTFITPTIKVALFYNTGAVFDTSSDYAAVEPSLLADGYLGYTWYTLDLQAGDFAYDGISYSFPNQTILFGRDSTATPFIFNGVAVIDQDQVGSNHKLIATQQSSTDLIIYSGQGANIYIAGGYIAS